MFGYFWACVTRKDRYDDLEFRKHLRKWQMGKLWDLITRTKRSPEHFSGHPAIPFHTSKLEEDVLREANELLAASKAASGQATEETESKEPETVNA